MNTGIENKKPRKMPARLRELLQRGVKGVSKTDTPFLISQQHTGRKAAE
jgi:hypothetical protein